MKATVNLFLCTYVFLFSLGGGGGGGTTAQAFPL